LPVCVTTAAACLKITSRRSFLRQMSCTRRP
jgi:hypothetical protein